MGGSKVFRAYHFLGNYYDRFKSFGETLSPKMEFCANE